MIKNNLTLLLVLFFSISYGQVTFKKLPLNKQLVGRDVATNKGDIIVEGEVDNSGVNYDAIEVELFRDGVLQNASTQTKTLTFTGNTAPFNFTVPITAELHNYSIKVYGKQGAILTLVEEVVDLVAGDVYIIQGQSNAEAKKRGSSSANSNQSEFIRVFGNGTDNNLWYIGEGDEGKGSDGSIGQWGLKLAKLLVDNLNIPIAILNGAEGGEIIDYYLSQNSNYANLYSRLDKSGLKNKVKAVFWSQGEQDGGVGTSTEDYKKSFLSLKTSWLNDYPAIEKFYIFQTKKGCNTRVFKIQEAQRQLAFENSDISIMSTTALKHSDNCHFEFINGYEEFAKRIFSLVQRDIYGVTTTVEIDAPMIQSARLIEGTYIEVVTDAKLLSIATTAEDFVLEDANQDDISNTITKITVDKNKIIFTLSSDPGEQATISYLAQEPGNSGNFITNSNGLEILCFYRYPLSTGALEVSEEELKNTVTVKNEKDSLVIKSKNVINQVKVYDIMGRLLIDNKPNTEEFQINTQNIEKGTVIVLNITFENGVEISKKFIKY